MSEPVRRRASRVLCLDPAGRVLMTAVVDPAEPEVTRWVAPGGGIDPGESPHDAACRELWEELGLQVDDLGPAVATSESRFTFDDRPYHQLNSWFAVRTAAFEPEPVALGSAELAFTVGTCWMHPDELDSVGGTHRVEPDETSTLVREAHERLPPAVLRPTVRVLVVDAADRVLLMSVNGCWFAPGGGLDPGETHEQAARRELGEGLGLSLGSDADVGPWVWTRRVIRPAGAPAGAPTYDLRERWHLLLVDTLLVDTLDVDRSGWTAEEVATVQDVRWWTFEQIVAGGVFAPRSLGALLPPLVADVRAGLAASPVQVPL